MVPLREDWAIHCIVTCFEYRSQLFWIPSNSCVRREEECLIPVHSSPVTVSCLIENETWFGEPFFHFIKIMWEIIK